MTASLNPVRRVHCPEVGVERGQLGRPTVGLVARDQRPLVQHLARRLGQVGPDERVAFPALLAATIEPQLPDRGARAGIAGVPQAIGVAPGHPTDRLETRPRVGRGTIGEVHDHDAPDQQPGIARIALDDGDMPRVRGERHALEGALPRVQRPRRPGTGVQGHQSCPVPTVARRIVGDQRDQRAAAVPVGLPHALAGGPDLLGLAGRQVHHEQPSPGVARSPDTRGDAVGAGHRACRPIEGVRPRIGGEDQQPLAVGGPGDALRRTVEGGRQPRLVTRCHRVWQVVAGGDPVRQEREPGAVGRPRRRAALRQAGRRSIEPAQPDVAREVAPHVIDGREEGKGERSTVRRDREVGRRARVQQGLIERPRAAITSRAH